jgi:hypothetical protein
MRSNELTRDRARTLKNKTHPMLGYLGRLKYRMHDRRFPSDDLLFLTVVKTYDAIHELNVPVHYLSCGNGVRSCAAEKSVPRIATIATLKLSMIHRRRLLRYYFRFGDNDSRCFCHQRSTQLWNTFAATVAVTIMASPFQYEPGFKRKSPTSIATAIKTKTQTPSRTRIPFRTIRQARLP